MTGYFALILHAHLPFVRHPEQADCLEEQWLFEAMVECYLPLAEVMENWLADGLPLRLTLSVSPTLAALLSDPLLHQRFQRYLAARIQLANLEEQRNYLQPAIRALVERYHQRLRRWQQTLSPAPGQLLRRWQRLHQAGLLELMTCSATHAVLPLLASDQGSLRAQLGIAQESFRRVFGMGSRGFWLPECAYVPELESNLRAAGFSWFVLESHGLQGARPRPRYGLFAPVVTPQGLAAFGRDQETARQVWSREIGYPGDPRYRDFYRDIAFDLDLDYLRPFLPAPGCRSFTGFKYHAITGPSTNKQIYHPPAAQEAVLEHAHDFLKRIQSHMTTAPTRDRPPLLTAPFDAELFGHWWHEGVEFLDAFVRLAAAPQSGIQLMTPSDYLSRHPLNQRAVPAASSWGEGGYWRVWLNEANAWAQSALRVAQQRMGELSRRPSGFDDLQDRATRQAGRELLLAQASDWPFLLQSGNASSYAHRRLQEHLHRFHSLCDQIRQGHIDEPELQRLEHQDNLFPWLESYWWANAVTKAR